MNRNRSLAGRMVLLIGLLLTMVEFAWGGSDEPSGSGRIAALLATGDYSRVVEEGKPLLESARQGKASHEAIQILVPMGMAAQALGSFPEAAASLQEAQLWH